MLTGLGLSLRERPSAPRPRAQSQRLSQFSQTKGSVSENIPELPNLWLSLRDHPRAPRFRADSIKPLEPAGGLGSWPCCSCRRKTSRARLSGRNGYIKDIVIEVFKNQKNLGKV